jgi:hypothetical protein
MPTALLVLALPAFAIGNTEFSNRTPELQAALD